MIRKLLGYLGAAIGLIIMTIGFVISFFIAVVVFIPCLISLGIFVLGMLLFSISEPEPHFWDDEEE